MAMMATNKIWELYLSQPYLTPGAVETVEIARQHIAFGPEARVVEIAFGKGTTAFALAEEYGCRIVGVDAHGFAAAVRREARKRGLSDRAAFLRGDGGMLPLRDGQFDAAICIGAPSIVGTERCMAAMYASLRPGGLIVVSDWTWRTKDVPPAAIPSTFTEARMTLDGYAAIITAAGFEIVKAEHLPQRVWDDYYAPLREAIAERRKDDPSAPEDPIESEMCAYDAAGHEYWGYTVFVARKASV
jgi:SAM-dependent methyltransferase